jgi:hypothetical protein
MKRVVNVVNIVNQSGMLGVQRGLVEEGVLGPVTTKVSTATILPQASKPQRHIHRAIPQEHQTIVSSPPPVPP